MNESIMSDKKSFYQNVLECYKVKQEKEKDNRRRLNGSVFCNMSLAEELTITLMNVTQVSYVCRHQQP